MSKFKNKILVFALALVMSLGVFAGLGFNKNSMSVYASGDSKTVADIMPEDFPTTKEDGWINENGAKLYFNEGTLYINDGSFAGVTSNTSIYFSSDTKNYYWSESHGGVTIRIDFYTNEGDITTLESIKVSKTPLSEDVVYGTYTAPQPAVTIAYILPDDFPTTEATAWVNEEGALCYLDSSLKFVKGDNSVSIGADKVLTPLEGNYKYASLGGWSATFNMEDGKLVSVTFDTVKDNLQYLKGEYKAITSVAIPTVDTTQQFVYDGQPKTFVVPTSEYYTISDNTTQTNAGTYTITVALKNAQYKWADGTTDDLTYTFVINQKLDTVEIKQDGEIVTDKSQAKVRIIEANGGIAPDAVFVVKTIPNTNTESINNTENVLRENNKLEKQEVVAVYDAKLLVNNVEVQPNGIIKIKMLVPEEVKGNNFKLYHIHNGTEVIEVNYTAVDENGYITFETDKLSEFAFATDIEDTGLSAGAIIGIVLGSLVGLAIIAYIFGYFFLYRKGKLDDRKIKVIYKILPRGENNLKEEKQTTTKKTPKNK